MIEDLFNTYTVFGGMYLIRLSSSSGRPLPISLFGLLKIVAKIDVRKIFIRVIKPHFYDKKTWLYVAYIR